MDPAVLNYLQSQQNNQQQTQPQEQPQGMQQQNMGQAPYNPFDVGISKAIESARQSLGLTQKQQDKALRSSMLTFGNNIAQQPKQRGFFNNFASVGRALSPAIATHDQEEEAGLQENNALANQILKYQGAEQDRQEQAEHRDWQRQHAEAGLAETRRAHNLMDNFRRERATPQSKLSIEQERQALGQADIRNVLDEAEAVITDSGSKGYRNRAERIANKLLPGGYNLNEEEAAVNALGDVLRGKLFNHFKYRNQTEFKHLPSISADNPPEVNLSILKQLRQLFAEEGIEGELEGRGEEAQQSSITLSNDNGDILTIPANDEEAIQDAMNDGYHE